MASLPSGLHSSQDAGDIVADSTYEKDPREGKVPINPMHFIGKNLQMTGGNGKAATLCRSLLSLQPFAAEPPAPAEPPAFCG